MNGQTSQLPEDIIRSMPHDAYPMGVLVNAMSAFFVFHPDANPTLRDRISLDIIFRYGTTTSTN